MCHAGNSAILHRKRGISRIGIQNGPADGALAFSMLDDFLGLWWCRLLRDGTQ